MRQMSIDTVNIRFSDFGLWGSMCFYSRKDAGQTIFLEGPLTVLRDGSCRREPEGGIMISFLRTRTRIRKKEPEQRVDIVRSGIFRIGC